MKIVGANPYSGRVERQYNANYEVQSGLVVDGSTRVALSNSSVSKVWGDFVTVESKSSYVTISGNQMTTDGRQGIAVTNAQHVTIDGNTMNDMRRSVFDLEANYSTDVIDDIRIVNNTTGDSRLVWLANSGKSTHNTNTVIENNTMLGTGLAVIYSKTPDGATLRRGPWTIDNNRFKMRSTTWDAMTFIGSAGISVHDNVVRIPKGINVAMVRASRSDQLQVHHNDFTFATKILAPGDTTSWCESDNLPAALSRNVSCDPPVVVTPPDTVVAPE
jgi:hypothetical protein